MQTDLALVKLCKDGDKAAHQILFNRYIPFLSKKYYSACRTYKGFANVYEFTDFISEGYIAFTKAIKYADVAKITDEGNWKFLGVYMWFVSTMRTKLINTIRKTNSAELPMTYPTDEETESDSSVDFKSTFISPEHKACEEAVVTSFYKSLTPYEQQIVAARCATDTEGNPKPIAKIAIARREPFSRVQHACKILEKKFAAAQ